MAQITQHANHQRSIMSETQHAFQFTRTKRFAEQLPECPLAFYGIESHRSNRRAHIGFGQKSDFTKTSTVSPPSTRYKHKSIFEQSKIGRTFACSRDKASPNDSYLMPQLHKNPGPGQYDNQIHGRTHETFTSEQRTAHLTANKVAATLTPGPASYEFTDHDKESGRYFVGKYHDVKLATIDPYTKRFASIQNKSPGPSRYEPEDCTGERTSYLLSNYQGKGNRPFDKEARFTFSHWKTDSNPGPGRYDVKSGFGVESSKKSYHF